MTIRRTTNIAVQIEEKPPITRRTTALAVMVEAHPPLPRRVTALAVMVECLPVSSSGAVYPGMAYRPPMWGTFQ